MKFRAFIEAWDDLVVYAVTLLGVLVTQYLPAFRAGQDFTVTPKWGTVLVAGIIALSFVLKDEEIPQGVDKAAARLGKKANFRRRLSNGLYQGMAWSALSGAVT